jgi:hypothetical protein
MLVKEERRGDQPSLSASRLERSREKEGGTERGRGWNGDR